LYKALSFEKTNSEFTRLDLFSDEFLTGIQLFNFHFHSHFLATVCKTVRPMLSDRCLSCLSVTLMYCDQTFRLIKIKLGKCVRLGPGHIVLDGDPAQLPSPERGGTPNFWPISIVAKWLDGSRYHLERR